MVAPALLVAMMFGAHSRSEGTSRFELHPHDRVAIVVELSILDLPELCDVDLTLSDSERRALEALRLDACIEAGLSRWLRLSTPTGSCALHPQGFERRDGRVVVIKAEAACPPLPGAALTIDWGFFAGQRLDHLNVATVVVTSGTEEKALLSRRHNRLTVNVPWPWHITAVAGASLLAASVAMGVIARTLWRRRRRRHMGHDSPDTPSLEGTQRPQDPDEA